MTIRSKISDSTYVLNIPEVNNFSAEFVYNYYTVDERSRDFFASPYTTQENNYLKVSIDRYPRYVNLNWELPVFFDFNNPVNTAYFIYANKKPLEDSVDKILEESINEDDSFTPQYVSQNFSDISSINQGAIDLNVYAKLAGSSTQSAYKKQKELLQSIIDKSIVKDKSFYDNLKSITEAYDGISDFPSDLLGLNVYENIEGGLTPTDDRGFFKNLASSLLINLKIHKIAINDFFAIDEVRNNPKTLEFFSTAYNQAKIFNEKYKNQSDPIIPAFKANAIDDLSTLGKVEVVGFLLYRYRKVGEKLEKDYIEFINDPKKRSYVDARINYGVTYVYALSIVAKFSLLGKVDEAISVKIPDYQLMSFKVTSRQTTTSVSCVEFAPPPPPGDINFIFDYIKRNVVMQWDFPVNPQHDIKQFQVFRRRTVNEPFELIAQYGFDNSIVPSFESRYLTGEVIDANNIGNVLPELSDLVKFSSGPVYQHIDNDFVIDTEFFETTSFIYAFCSIDAHGMISNYSSQYQVSFDPFKNKLITKMICDEGSPRAYPNMNLKVDAFKDSINAHGNYTKELQIHFTPEYFKVQSEQGKVFNVVESKKTTNDQQPFYLLQMINLDNQKVQTIKINVLRDETLPTVPSDQVSLGNDVESAIPPAPLPPDPLPADEKQLPKINFDLLKSNNSSNFYINNINLNALKNKF